MGTLQLKLDPTGLEAAAARARGALDGVKGAAVSAESALDQMGKMAGPMFGPMNREGAQAKATFDSLRQSIDPTFAASVRYKNAVLDIDTALRAQVITQREAANMMGLVETKMGAVGRGGFAAGGGMRMLGQQLSQVAQQGAVTGNYLGALAVQLPDMALGFGSIAIAASIVATVALPLLIGAFGGGKTAAEQATDATEAYASSFDLIKTGLEGAAALEGQYTEALKTGSAQRVEAIRMEADVRAKLLELDLLDQSAARTTAASAMVEAHKKIADALHEQAEFQNILNQSIATGQAIEDQSAAAKNLKEATEELERQQGLYERQSLEFQLIQAQIDGNNDKLEVTRTLLDRIADGVSPIEVGLLGASDAADGIASANMAGNIAAALGPAQALAGYLANAYAAAGNMARAADAAANTNPAVTRLPGGVDAIARGEINVSGQNDNGGGNVTRRLPTIITGGGSSGGGGGGGGAAQIDRTREAYDRLMASLDPVVAKTQDMAKATETADAALAANDITAAEHARALDLIRDKYTETADAMGALKDAGGNAIDGLINGTMNLSEALKQMAKDLIFATLKAELLNSVTGAKEGMSLGGIIMQALIPAKDGGGNIPMGTMAMVGERGPELVTAGRSGAMVTSRVDTARMMQGGAGQTVHVVVHGGDLVLNDNGKISARIMVTAQAAGQNAVDTVRRNLAGWNNSLATDGAIA